MALPPLVPKNFLPLFRLYPKKHGTLEQKSAFSNEINDLVKNNLEQLLEQKKLCFL